MANVSIDIERVVREVMAELGLAAPPPRAESPRPVAQSPAADAKPSGETTARPPANPPCDELAVTSRVITLGELDGKLNGSIRRLVVPPRAVVTPSVRDELRRRNVDLVFGQANGKPREAAETGTALAVVAHGMPADAEGLIKALAAEGISVQPQQTECLLAASDRLAEQLAAGDRLGLLLTKYSAAAVCLANRMPGVRAILGTDTATVAADAASVGANLLVVNPVQSGLFRSRKIIGQFYRQGLQPCPAVFQQRLK